MKSRLSPYLQRSLAAAEARALEIHGDEVGCAHLLERILDDSDSALHEAILDSFADPEGMAVESLALAPGILIVGSGEATPFSTRAVTAMRAARSLAIERGANEVTPHEVLFACADELPDGRLDALTEAGLKLAAALENAPGGTSTVREEGHLFHAFSPDARRMLVFAARESSQAKEGSISPARLLMAALQTDRDLGERSGLTSHRARLLLAAHTTDATLAPERSLPLDPAFHSFLSALPANASSLDVGILLLSESQDELAQILLRQKVSPERLQAAQSVFSDPR